VSSITRTPSHVLTAVEDGMKAGFKQFASASAKSGLAPVQELWSEFEPLNSKSKFNLYCTMFGPAVEGLGAPKVSATRASTTVPRVDDDVQALLEQAKALTEQAAKLTEAKAAVKVADVEAYITPRQLGALIQIAQDLDEEIFVTIQIGDETVETRGDAIDLIGEYR
jgi:hypothetical protein